MTTIATIVQHSPDGRTKRWPVTNDDVLWMARTLLAEEDRYRNPDEGYHVGRVMTSMLVRRLAVHFFDGPFTSTTHLIRGAQGGGRPKGWSQPIRYYGLFHDSADMRARYLRHQSVPWSEIPDYYQRAAFDTLTGRAPLLAPHVVDAAAPAFTRDKMENPANPGHAQTVAEGWRREQYGTRSWLISTTKSRAWPEPIVTSEAGMDLTKILAGLGALVALAVLAKG